MLINYAMRDFRLVSHSHNGLQELHKVHIDVLVFIDFIDLGHHCQVIQVADRLHAEVVTLAICTYDTVTELTERHELKGTCQCILSDELFVDSTEWLEANFESEIDHLLPQRHTAPYL